MPTTTAIVAFLLGTAVFVVVPGPSVFFILGRAVALGRRAALLTAAGNLAGVLVIVGAVSLGVGAVVERVAVALLVLKLAGAAYLVWLGVQAWRHRGDGPVAVTGMSGRRAFREGVIVGLTNPDRGTVTGQMLVLGVLFCALASTVDALWALGAGTARDWFARSPRRLRAMGGAGGLVMIGMGIGVATTGVHG